MKTQKRLFIIGLALFTLLALRYFSQEQADITTAGIPGVEDRSAEIGAPAPTFELRRHGSKDLVSLSDIEGDVVMLNFWGAWCRWCRRELPHIVDFARSRTDIDVVVVGILNHKSAADTAATDSLVEEYGIPFLNLTGIDSVFSKYGVPGYPTTVVLDRNGVVRERIVGYTETTEFHAAAHRAMAPIDAEKTD